MNLDVTSFLYTAAGVIGSLLLAGSYLAFQTGRLNRGIPYSLINLLAAGLLLVSLLHKFNLGSFMIEVFWLSTTLYFLWRDWRKVRTARSQPFLRLPNGAYLIWEKAGFRPALKAFAQHKGATTGRPNADCAPFAYPAVVLFRDSNTVVKGRHLFHVIFFRLDKYVAKQAETLRVLEGL